MAEFFVQEDPALKHKQELARLMMLRGMDASPIRTGAQSLDRLAKALMGAYQNKQATGEIRDRDTDIAQLMKSAAVPQESAPGMDLGAPQGMDGLIKSLAGIDPRSSQKLAGRKLLQDDETRRAKELALWKRDNDVYDRKTTIYRDMEAAGYAPGSEEWENEYRRQLQFTRTSPMGVDMGGYRGIPDGKGGIKSMGETTLKPAQEADHLGDVEGAKGFAKNQEKWRASEPQVKAKIAAAKSQHQIIEATVERLKPLLDKYTTAYGANLRAWPGTEAKRVANLLITLKANAALSTMLELKETSPTGSTGFGALSAPELVILESKFGSMDQFGDANDLKQSIDHFVASNNLTVQRMTNTYNDERARYSLNDAPEIESKASGDKYDDMTDEELAAELARRK